jgi:hypothetical protein
MVHQIKVTIQNDLGADYCVHVYDEYGGPPAEVSDSPFQISSNDCSPVITVNADNRNNGVIGYSCDGGPSKHGIAVRDGQNVPM